MAKKVQLMTNAKEWQTVNGVEVLVDVPQEDLDPITDSNCVEIEGHRTLEETIGQENMFTPETVETKVHSKVGGVYHDNVVDGAYEEAILYGNTQVNLVESMTSDTKYIPHSFTSFQGNESKIGNYHNGRTNQVAPLVKGVTMVNLAQKTSVTIREGSNGGAIKNVKPNTKYTLFLDFTVQNTQKGFSIHSFKDNTTYLETATVRTGMGEKVKFTFTTHEEANTIYIVNNTGFGGEIQLDNIMVIEGDVTDLDLPFFKGMRSVELSKPLTNLFTDDLVPEVMGVTVTNSGGTVTVTSTTISQWASARYHLDLKPNTKYVIMWDGLTFTQTASGIDYIISVCENDTIFSHMGNKFTTLRSIIFDTGDKSAISIRIHATTSNSETGTTTVTGLRVFEWDDSLRTLDLQTIGYFSGTKYVSVRALETEGKNLYPYGDINFTSEFANSWCDSKGNAYMAGDIADKSQARFLLRKGTYYLSNGINSNVAAIQLVDDKENLLISPFTLTQDTYCTLRVKTVEANVETTVTNIQIERGETATTYEAYQSRYYKPRETEEIILRSLPNGVCDTFNLQTGEYVQRVKEIVLDGSSDESWTKNTSLSDDNYTILHNVGYTEMKVETDTLVGNMNCDKFKNEWYAIDGGEGIARYANGKEIVLKISTSKLTTQDSAGLREYLASNPLTVQYELKEPIITKLQTYARVYSGQTNARTNMGNNLSALTYYSNNYYLKVGNLSPVPAILEPITTIPYDVRLKPSTLYTIKYNRGGNSNSMKFDLGGSVVEKTNATTLDIVPEEFTVRTPAILSHEQLILSGTGYAHNFIIVEGDITGTELPFFEGMKDVKMPIVKNVGKNLFDGELYIDMGINANGKTGYGLPQGMGNSPDWVTTKNLIPITKGKKISITINADDEDITTNRRYVYVYKYDMNGNFMVNDRYDLGLDTKTFTMNHYGYIKCTIRTHNVKNITITETDTPQPCIDYKENSVYAVQSEYPITSEMIEQGGFSMPYSNDGSYENAKYDNTARLRSKELIPVKPNTTYAFAHSFSKFAYNVYQWNGNKKFIDEVSQYFNSGQIETVTTTADTQYIHFLMSKHDASQTITVAEYDWSQFHMYELDSTINLRSLPNGVKDEFNLLTGEYIQRVGEVVLDGSEEWVLRDTNNYLLQMPFQAKDSSVTKNGLNMITNSSICANSGYYIVGDYMNHSNTLGIDNNLLIYNSYKTQHSIKIDSWKNHLSQNPITVQYELAEPIISHVRLVSNNQEREVGVKLPNGVCNTYNPSTGITTVRVGKVVLDGSENWDMYDQAPSNLDYFRLPIPTMFSTGNMNADKEIECKYIVSDTFPTVGYYAIQKANSTINYSVISGMFSSSLGVQCLYVYHKPSADLATFKAYLASNPITVWYELKYPQIQPDIVLPNGVRDEYNPETGLYTKRVMCVEFDGSEDEGWRAAQTDPNRFVCEILTDRKYYSSDVIKDCMLCDKITVVSYKELYGTDGTDGAYGIAPFGSSANIQMRLEGITTAEQLQQYLSQNPIKVWYELATPITYQLTPYFGLPQPYAYEDGYLIHESAYPETTLPPEFKYKLVANRTGQIVQNGRKLQEHTTRLSNLEALIIEATIESLFNRELQLFELELMDIQLIDLGE